MHLKQKNVASCTQDKSYPGQVARRQLFTDYDSSIEYISIARNFRHDGHHNQGANFVKRFYHASENVGDSFICNQIWVIGILSSPSLSVLKQPWSVVYCRLI